MSHPRDDAGRSRPRDLAGEHAEFIKAMLDADVTPNPLQEIGVVPPQRSALHMEVH